MNDDGVVYRELYELQLDGEDVIELEYVEREDWNGLSDPCPECDGTEFDHMRYTGGHYGQEGEAVIMRTDYWYQHGSLYTECKDCDEVLYKSPAYDIIEAMETGEFEDFTASDSS